MQGMVKNMMADPSIKYTNHSLRATGATTLVDSGVQEAIIQKCGGHHSTKTQRMYERVTPDQDLAVSKNLHSTSKVLFNTSGNPTASSSCQISQKVILDHMLYLINYGISHFIHKVKLGVIQSDIARFTS